MAVGAAATVAAPLAAAGGQRRKPPNILLLFTDDQRFDTIRALGNGAIETPSMDRLVEQGTTFTHCHIMGSTSGAVCICSRASLITGRHLFNVPHTPKADDELALWPQVFRENGYSTFGTGKWHNGPWTFAQSFTSGESIFFGGMSDHLKVPIHSFDPSGRYAREDRTIGTSFSSEMFSNAAVRFLDNRESDNADPFFMYVSYTAPHDPRMAPQDFADRYRPDEIELPPNFLPEHPFDNGEMRIRDEMLAGFPRTPDEIREHIAAYYAMITHVDHHIGRVLDALDASGEAENTIIVIAGDNGLAVGQHGLLGKQNLYEHSVRVPLTFSGRGIARNRRSDALVYLHDIFPTTCELAGLETPETVESESLVPLIKRRGKAGRESVFGAYKDGQRMVRDDRWKLIRYPYADEVQLFDLQDDPWEINNLASDPAHAGTIAELDEKLSEWQEVAGDTIDPKNPPPKPGLTATPVKSQPDGSYVLEPGAAKTPGSLVYQPDRENLGGWFSHKDCPEWKLVNVQAGVYEVEYTYGSTNPGCEFEIVAGNSAVVGQTEHTGGMKTYKATAMGEISLPAGEVQVAIRPKPFSGAIMNFRLLRLRPAQR